MKDSLTIISISIDKELLNSIKDSAKKLQLSTSSYIRLCVIKQLQTDVLSIDCKEI